MAEGTKISGPLEACSPQEPCVGARLGKMQGVKGWERQVRVSGPEKTAPVLGNLLKGLGLQCKLGHSDQGKTQT